MQLPMSPRPAPGPLRDYQREAVEAIDFQHKEVRSTLLVLATGLGKSRIIAEVCVDTVARGKRCLVVAHSVVLVNQLIETLLAAGLRVGVEQADRDTRCGFPPDVVVATVQTMTGRRLKRFATSHFGLVCVDEAHRSLTRQHRGVVDYFADAKVLGVTATPDRTDGKALAAVYDSVAYERSILWGIEHGWLAPLTLQTAHTDWDPKRLKEVAGEVSADTVEAELVRSGVMGAAAATLADLLKTGKRKAVVAFLPTVAAAKAFAVELDGHGISSGHVSGETPQNERERLFERFAAGAINVLCNCAVLVEGFDSPHTDCIALLSPTKSRSRLAQCIGRGTRNAPGKVDCLVLDFCPGRMTKGRLAAPADALAGKMLDDDVIGAVTDGNLVDALAAAEKTAEELKELRARAEDREREKRERLDRLKRFVQPKEAAYSVERHDAGSVLGDGSEGREGLRENRVARVELTDEQRRRAGLATAKQAAVLKRAGLNPNMRRNLANEALGVLSANRWRWPGPVPERFLPPASARR